MALRDLVDGECGRVNSLFHLTSHFLQDRSHKEDGLRHQAPYEDTFANADADQLAQEFINETLFHPPQTFRMDSLLQEMREMESAASQHAPVQAPGVAASLASNDRDWSREFLEHSDQPGELQDSLDQTDEYQEPQHQSGEYQDPFDHLGVYQDPLDKYQDPISQQNDTWEPAAEEVFSSVLLQADEAFTEEQRNHSVWGNAARDSFLNGNNVDYWRLLNNSRVEAEVFDDMYNDMYTDDDEGFPYGGATDPKDDVKKPVESIKSDLWTKLLRNFEQAAAANRPWAADISELSDPFKEYPFESENPMKDQLNALEEGKRRREVGDLSGAVLCFEAAVLSEPKNSEAWQLLGSSQAENEQDPQAISALKNCLALEPGNLKALMSIAISYTNENYPFHAFLHLKEWLRHNPHYSHLVPKVEESSEGASSTYSDNLHKDVQDLYIAAARLHPLEDIDPDVQCGLGVLFNLSREYDKAADCFKAALQVKQSDSRTWNRLGATLANGDRSEEAVEAYQKALALAPGYIRARYNVGITCMNLNAHTEAIEHFLIALNQQAQAKGIESSGKATMSDSIWSTLRIVLALNDRRDLMSAVQNQDLALLNKEFGIDVKLASAVPSS